MGHVLASELPCARRCELAPRDRGSTRAAPSRDSGAGAMRYVVALELPRARRRELEPWDTWQLQSYPVPGGGSWRHRMHGST
jgi:hypothetical protein